jgi:hypothetical protein
MGSFLNPLFRNENGREDHERPSDVITQSVLQEQNRHVTNRNPSELRD